VAHSRYPGCFCSVNVRRHLAESFSSALSAPWSFKTLILHRGARYQEGVEKELRYLSFMGGNSRRSRLYDKQRQQLELRASFIRSVQAHPDHTYLDPVLRYHLGLDPATPEKNGKDR
jgi:hypothetical protein